MRHHHHHHRVHHRFHQHRHRNGRRRQSLQGKIFVGFGVTIAATAVTLHLLSFFFGQARWPLVLIGLGSVWFSAGFIARRLAGPLEHIARVAMRIGDGDLHARAGIDWRMTHEVAVVATAIDEMASRIETQMNDQRALLAGVSHELRSPLARLRLLSTLLRDRGPSEKLLDEVDREVVEMDDLVGKLLASARLDFSLDQTETLDGADLARRALARAQLDESILRVEGTTTFVGDPTLIARALENLLENARIHGRGATAVRVQGRTSEVRFLVDDDGPGLPDDEPVDRLFAPFFRGRGSGAKGGLGLGLALVKRIALAHDGTVFAENRAGHGARVGFSVAVSDAG